MLFECSRTQVAGNHREDCTRASQALAPSERPNSKEDVQATTRPRGRSDKRCNRGFHRMSAESCSFKHGATSRPGEYSTQKNASACRRVGVRRSAAKA